MTRNWLAMGLLAALVLTGCAKESAEKEAAEHADHSAYTQTAEARLAAMDAKIDSLKAYGETAADSTKAAIHQDVEALQMQRDQMKQRLDELGQATEDKWEETKAATVTGLDSLDAAWDRARARMH